jgi:hypothetical protein
MSTNGSINIINGFFVGSNVPIDYRMVAFDSTERDAIVHKYDGLKVFLTSTRESWIWNEGTTSWEADATGTLVGGGSASYIPRWDSSQSLENSNLYNISNRIGLNTTNPIGSFHIYGTPAATYSSVLINTNPNSSGISRNSYDTYGVGLHALDTTYGSAYITLGGTTNQSYISFNIRKGGSAINAFNQHLILGEKDSLGRYNNILTANGDSINHIVGSMSISDITNPFTNSMYNTDLLFVNGSFRSNGTFTKQTTGIDYSYSAGYIMSISNLNNQTNNYNVTQTLVAVSGGADPVNGIFNMVNEHEIIVNNLTNGGTLKKLTFNLPLNPNVGREVVIDYVKGSTYSAINSSLSYKDLSGTTITSFNLNPGERVKVIYNGGTSPYWQIVELVSDTQVIKNDINYLKSAIEVQTVNGTSGVGASQSTYQINRTILNGTEITVEATITGQALGTSSNLALVSNLPIIPQSLKNKKYFKIRHLIATLIGDSYTYSSSKIFYLTFNHLVNNGNTMILTTPLTYKGEYMWIDDTISDKVVGATSGSDFVDAPYVTGEMVDYNTGLTHILPVISSYPINMSVNGSGSNPINNIVTIKIIMSGYLI